MIKQFTLLMCCMSLVVFGFTQQVGTIQPPKIEQVTAIGQYTLGETESIMYAQAQAVSKAKENAVNQAGTLQMFQDTMKNYQLTDQQVVVLSGTLLAITVNRQWREFDTTSNLICFAEITAKIDTSNIAEVRALLRDKNFVAQYLWLQQEYLRLFQEMTLLKQQVAAKKTVTSVAYNADATKKTVILTNQAGKLEQAYHARTLAQQGLVRKSKTRVKSAMIRSASISSAEKQQLLQKNVEEEALANELLKSASQLDTFEIPPPSQIQLPPAKPAQPK